MNDNRDIEEIRESYKPEKVKFLFVGESPPEKGVFFYETNKKCNMTTYTKRAFEQAHSVNIVSNNVFLDYLKRCNCYLDDLCHIPVNTLSQGTDRKARLQMSVDSFASRLREINPEHVIVVGQGINGYVKQAVDKSGSGCNIHVLPFAGNGHQNKYIEQLATIIEKHIPIPE